jgi:hypothetical protein
MSDDIQPISAKEAHDILYAAITDKLGEDWDDEHQGWTIVSGHDYMARLSDGRYTIDFYVDLVGNVTIEEKDNMPNFENGRLTAWMVLGVSLFVAFVIARVAGVF